MTTDPNITWKNNTWQPQSDPPRQPPAWPGGAPDPLRDERRHRCDQLPPSAAGELPHAVVEAVARVLESAPADAGALAWRAVHAAWDAR